MNGGMMRSLRVRALCAAALALFAGLFTPFAAEAQDDAARFKSDLQVLAAGDARLAGTEPCLKASAHVEARLKQAGADSVLVQEFFVPQTVVRLCELQLDGAAAPLKLQPMRADGIIPPVTPPGGVSGRLVDLRKGTQEDYSGHEDFAGSIAVMDYNSGQDWLQAFRLGAKAVVFVRNGPCEAANPHHVDANVNMLRFFYPGPRSDLTEGTTATIRSEVVWTNLVGRNVYGFFHGTNAVFSAERNEEMMVVAANIDGYGDVPGLSPSARAAANCASLLQIADLLGGRRPRRNMLLAFFDGQARGHSGSEFFYRALENDNKDGKVEERAKWLAEETSAIAARLEYLAREKPLEQKSDVRRDVFNELSLVAADLSFRVRSAMYKLGRERTSLKKADGWQKNPVTVARVDEINRIISEELQLAKDEWNDVQRAIGKDRVAGLAPGVQAKLDSVVGVVRQQFISRQGELRAEGTQIAQDLALKALVGKCWTALHVSMLLGDRSDRWGAVIGGDSCFHWGNDDMGHYGKVKLALLEAARQCDGVGGFERASVDSSVANTRVLLPSLFLTHSGEIAGANGIYNIVAATIGERLDREGTPDDTLANLDADRVRRQGAEVAALLLKAADLDGLSLNRGIVYQTSYSLPSFHNGRIFGPRVMGRTGGSSMANTVIPGAVVQMVAAAGSASAFVPNKARAFDNFRVRTSNQNGSYAASLHYPNGFAAAFDRRGAVSLVSSQGSIDASSRMDLFEGRQGLLVVPPQFRLQYERTSVMDAKGDSPLDITRSFSELRDGVLYWYLDPETAAIKVFGLTTMVGLGNGAERFDGPAGDLDKAYGAGFPVNADSWLPSGGAMRAAADLWRLNEARIGILRAKDLMEGSLGELHGRVEDMIVAAGAQKSAVRREAMASAAYMSAQPVYRKSRAILDDLVFAVLILLGLCVPFAFAAERLVIGSTTIYKQVGGFAAIFTVTFLMLYLSHPAFSVSAVPMIIFLGFAVLLLSCSAIFILMRKFEVELKTIQGVTQSVHADDISRTSTVLAAVSMGISTMRRRPVRTALTAVTIVLLTFTILCFASFGTSTGIIRVFTEPNPAYTGVFMHDVAWAPFNTDILNLFAGLRGEGDSVCSRWWIAPKRRQEQGCLVTRQGGDNPWTIRGILGIDQAELDRRKDMADVFGPSIGDGEMVLAGSLAASNALAVKAGDTVVLNGKSLKVARVMDAALASLLTDMDGSSVMPVDFGEMAGMMQQTQTTQPGESGAEDAMLARRSWATLSPDSVAIVSAATARELGAQLHAVHVYTDGMDRAGPVAEDLARALPFPVAGTRPNGVYRHLLGTVLAASGVRDLFFPIILGGLVIFGTMLGSVTDRQKEIYTFSALGLAPGHVAMLFLAEATVYSVLGGMGGYLIAQTTAKVMAWLARQGLVTAPYMNVSSTNVIVTLLIVMATVLVSAIYPAVKASRSANPGLLRTWRPPPPKGDVLDMVFPFTVSDYDITGVVSFLKEHFDNFSNVGLGKFMAQEASLIRTQAGGLGVGARITLAPFDLGVSQQFRLWSVPSKIAGIEEVRVRLERTSGQPKDWQRLNRVFLFDLRKQLLIWRSLTAETMEGYRRSTLTVIGGVEREGA